ncbi:MAG: aminotransferase class III-fold pyridoxal phosphate-dependent enzyme [Planctomycetota bacterium]
MSETAVDGDGVADALRDAFGVDPVEVRPLPGELDRNALVSGRDGALYVAKAFSAGTPRAWIEFQRDLADHAVTVDPALEGALPRFVGEGDRIRRVDLGGEELDAALLGFVEGRPMARVTPHAPDLLRDVGALVGRVARALSSYSGTVPARTDDVAAAGLDAPSWRLTDGPEVVAARLSSVPAGARRRDLVSRVLERFDGARRDAVGSLRGQVLHQDANDHNVLVRVDPGGPVASGLIDLGDATHAPLVCEPAIAAAYAALGKRDPLSAMAHVVAGFHGALPLQDEEFDALFDLALLRLAVSVSVSSHRAASETGATDYHLVTEAPAWKALEALTDVHPGLASAVLRDAAGLAAVPRAARFTRWARARSFEPVLGAPLDGAPRVDLSLDGPLVVDAGRDRSLDEWGADLEVLRRAQGTPATVGHHDETRLLYATDAFQDAREDGPEPRTVHLGVDLFAPAGTEVRAPLDGVVVSAVSNPAPLDYGPTLILEHEGDDGRPFSTLYGHLDGEVLERLTAGDRVSAGEVVARLGDESENGGWPPHLHFQVVLDRLGRVGDFPGVAAPTWRRAWTGLCPDPAPVLGLESCDAREPRAADLHAERRAWFCRSMSIQHEARPLQIVRGRGTTLFDSEGRAFLDAVNNVPHVGHCHPRVVAAGQRQMALLNTNTRYLHEGLHRYAERLRALLPKHLEVLYFVCSGSEANEVALRLARAATDGATDVLVQEHGYHGHTGAAVARSHYKFAGEGGFEPPADVHVVPLADPYRGIHRGADSGPAYVAEVERVLAEIRAAGRRPAAMLAEAIIGCGGQVVPPAGYLAGAFDAVRAAGGVAIADEVQVGFGRVGTHVWAFDEQGATPDIVTMGKPMGNGHPIAAVATTREIAERFAGGMEFFATFGGNQVSAAIGTAVLDVIEDEALIANAREVGAHFLDRMAGLQARHEVIGDVRGRGLYLGVDLVRERDSRAPAGATAAYVALRMRDRGILVGTDGPAGNVLKIKPPLPFSANEMERLVDTLDGVLSETVVVDPDGGRR